MNALICMATFNGARWLPQQLASIVRQDDPDWLLLVSDDGSADETPTLLGQFAAHEPRCTLLEPRAAPGSACANFEYLLQAARDRLPGADAAVLLCDQDDIWAAHKLRVQRDALRHAPASCSELSMIGAGGEELGLLLEDQRSARQPSMRSLLAQNSAVGCALAIRGEVLDLALPFPPGLLNHDWWLALCAATLGEIDFTTEPLVAYRQHASNAIGAYRPLRQLFRLPALLDRQRAVLRSQQAACAALAARLTQSGSQVPAVLERYQRLLEQEGRSTRARALFNGEFATAYPPLRLLRTLAAWSLH